jgi:hypothetical protein
MGSGPRSTVLGNATEVTWRPISEPSGKADTLPDTLTGAIWRVTRALRLRSQCLRGTSASESSILPSLGQQRLQGDPGGPLNHDHASALSERRLATRGSLQSRRARGSTWFELDMNRSGAIARDAATAATAAPIA